MFYRLSTGVDHENEIYACFFLTTYTHVGIIYIYPLLYMKEKEKRIIMKGFMKKLDEKQINELIDTAIGMMDYSYVPYSHFHVGAALLAKNGTVYGGCNIENAGYTPSNCAERTAFFKAVSEGVLEFDAICVVGGANKELKEYAAPCGVCRQVMMEFCDPEEFQIILATGKEQYEIFTLKELLPLGFGPNNLKLDRREQHGKI